LGMGQDKDDISVICESSPFPHAPGVGCDRGVDSKGRGRGEVKDRVQADQWSSEIKNSSLANKVQALEYGGSVDKNRNSTDENSSTRKRSSEKNGRGKKKGHGFSKESIKGKSALVKKLEVTNGKGIKGDEVNESSSACRDSFIEVRDGIVVIKENIEMVRDDQQAMNNDQSEVAEEKANNQDQYNSETVRSENHVSNSDTESVKDSKQVKGIESESVVIPNEEIKDKNTTRDKKQAMTATHTIGNYKSKSLSRAVSAFAQNNSHNSSESVAIKLMDLINTDNAAESSNSLMKSDFEFRNINPTSYTRASAKKGNKTCSKSEPDLLNSDTNDDKNRGYATMKGRIETIKEHVETTYKPQTLSETKANKTSSRELLLGQSSNEVEHVYAADELGGLARHEVTVQTDRQENIGNSQNLVKSVFDKYSSQAQIDNPLHKDKLEITDKGHQKTTEPKVEKNGSQMSMNSTLDRVTDTDRMERSKSVTFDAAFPDNEDRNRPMKRSFSTDHFYMVILSHVLAD